MPPEEFAAVVGAATALLTAIATLVVAVTTLVRQQGLRDAVNGHTDRLVELISRAGFTAGIQAEREASGAAEALPGPSPPLGPSPTA